MKIKMNLERDTKGTFVYKAEDDDAAITSVYVKKAGVKGDAPKSITLDIKEL